MILISKIRASLTKRRAETLVSVSTEVRVSASRSLFQSAFYSENKTGSELYLYQHITGEVSPTLK